MKQAHTAENSASGFLTDNPSRGTSGGKSFAACFHPWGQFETEKCVFDFREITADGGIEEKGDLGGGMCVYCIMVWHLNY